MLLELLTKKYPGMRFWLMQRIAAVVMAIYIPIAAVYIAMNAPDSYETWVQLNQPVFWRLTSFLCMLSLCLHAWIGVRDVFRDYVRYQALRNVLQLLVELSLFAYLIWAAVIFWSI